MENSTEKFFFNLHNFDDGPYEHEDEVIEEEEEPEIDLPPPPPTYSEEELERAKAQAFEEGKQQGRQDAEASQQKAIQVAIEALSVDVIALQNAEAERHKMFQDELTLLIYAVFDKALPLFLDANSQSMLSSAITEGLKVAEDMPSSLEILTHPDDQAFVSKQFSDHGTVSDIIVKSSNTVAQGSCQIQWGDGGYAYDIRAVSDAIYGILNDTLHKRGLKADDISNREGVSADNCDIVEEVGLDIAENNSDSEETGPQESDDGDINE